MAFGDYIVYADESGDHSLTSIDSQFPVFVLAFCLIQKAVYIEHVVPAFQRFKFEFWGHDRPPVAPLRCAPHGAKRSQDSNDSGRAKFSSNG